MSSALTLSHRSFVKIIISLNSEQSFKQPENFSEAKYTRLLQKASFGTLAAGLVIIILSAIAIASTLKATKQEIKTLTVSAQLKRETTSEFDSLLEGLRAAKKLRTGWGKLPFPDKAEVEQDLKLVINQAFAPKIREKNRLERENWSIQDISFSPDGKLLAISNPFVAEIWTIDNQEVVTLGGNTTFDSISFSPDGKLLATAGGGTAKIWTLESPEMLTLPAHKNAVDDVSFSPDGKLFATGLVEIDDYGFKIWTLEGEEVAPINSGEIQYGSYGTVEEVRFSPDGKLLAIADVVGKGVI
ncbi:WD40 repeat domain-containing protein [Oscillatoria salina]|uniref:WD40 repeat domain-containing protein n=1 Tax=Oscillatoria salina TaxID=331517 RepID=UPI001CCF4380|nr:hypothetical protein [Oscillatoria salina]MBZ8180023.1 hypothetical protein [Oscillatoria salina IIICB1]